MGTHRRWAAFMLSHTPPHLHIDESLTNKQRADSIFETQGRDPLFIIGRVEECASLGRENRVGSVFVRSLSHQLLEFLHHLNRRRINAPQYGMMICYPVAKQKRVKHFFEYRASLYINECCIDTPSF